MTDHEIRAEVLAVRDYKNQRRGSNYPHAAVIACRVSRLPTVGPLIMRDFEPQQVQVRLIAVHMSLIRRRIVI